MEIKQYIALLWRWTWLILLGALIAGAVAYVVSSNTTPVYQASAIYLIDEAPGSGSANEYAQTLFEQTLAQTYVGMVNRRPVREETIERLDLTLNESKLQGMVSISAIPDTQLISIRVEDTEPARAAAVANIMGIVFIEQNQTRENSRYAAPIDNWLVQLTEVANEIETLEVSINGYGEDEELTAVEQAALSRLQTSLNEAQIRYTDAFNKLNDLQVSQAQDSSNLIQIEEALLPRTPIRPRTTTNVLLAVIVGAMLAVGFVFLVDYLDDTIKSPQEIQADTKLTTLGTIALIKGDKPSERLITAKSPRDPISEAYRVLRTNLSFSAIDGNLTSILITSSSPGEGKSTTAANLAVVMAQTGQSVILVDADLRRPIQHKVFNVSNNQGLTTAILDSNTPISYHLQKTRLPELSILTSGPIPPNPAELLNSHRMTKILEELGREADIAIFDTPPVLTVADATILAPRTNGSLIVVESNKTRRNALVQATDRLNNANAYVLGTVINKLNPSRLRGYGYYYRYQYYYNSVKGTGRDKSGKRKGWLPGFIKR